MQFKGGFALLPLPAGLFASEWEGGWTIAPHRWRRSWFVQMCAVDYRAPARATMDEISLVVLQQASQWSPVENRANFVASLMCMHVSVCDNA